MALSRGARLGAYEVVAPIGAGGMGEVYRAIDTRLDRQVAVKVLPEDFFESEERRQRFEREAKLLAALNHPGIAAIYSFEEIPSSSLSSASRHILVMELLDGESLRDKLAAPLPPKKAVEYAVQVAHGLAAAHEKGIVHRDLKPENLFVTKDGRIKILDFGVAKFVQPAIPSISLTEAPTAAPATDAGVVLGTVGYMSPEQVLGRPLDARSDLFSLGVVLYEMLSGKRPFQRQTAPETMAAILREDPPELSNTNKTVSPGLERIVRHCLEKEPSGRFQSARDVAFDLESLSQSTTAGTAPLRAGGGRRRLVVAVLGGALVVAAAIAFGAFLHSRFSKPPEPRFHRLTFQRGIVTGARFLPDGQTVVYSAAWGEEPPQLYSVRLDSPESRPLGFRDAGLTAVSGKSDLALGLRSPAGRTLAVVPFSGGTPRVLAERVQSADFSPDGKTLAAATRLAGGPGELDVQLEYPVGTVVYHEPPFYIGGVRVSPRGDQVAFLRHPRGDTGGAVMVVTPGEKPRKLSSDFGDIGGLAWSPEGREIFFTAAKKGSRRDLHGVDLNGHERWIHGGPSSIALLDVARDGRILVSTLDRRRRILAGGGDLGTNRELSWFDFGTPAGISHDGKVVLFSETGEAVGASYLLFVRRTDGSPATRIGSGEIGDRMSLSPDGRFVVKAHLRPPAIEVIPVDAGVTRTISLAGFSEERNRWAGLLSDNRTVWFVGARPKEGLRYWTVDVNGGNHEPASREITRWRRPGITPDEASFLGYPPGKGLALLPRSGGEPLLVAGVSDNDLIAGGSEDGRFLYVFRQALPLSVRRVDVVTGKSELMFEVAPPDRVGASLVWALVTPDGRHHAYSMDQSLSELHVIEGLR
jgi:eukaryotic-like serine/threonine-protein kinase